MSAPYPLSSLLQPYHHEHKYIKRKTKENRSMKIAIFSKKRMGKYKKKLKNAENLNKIGKFWNIYHI